MAWDCEICGRRVDNELTTCTECGVRFCSQCSGPEEPTVCIDCFEEDEEEET